MSKKNNLKRFVCIDYPGNVINEQEAIRTLGGMERINQTLQRRNAKFLLNYNPDNIFSKMLCSTQIDDPNDLDLNASVNSSNGPSSSSQGNSNSFSDSHLPSASITNKHNELVSMPCLLMSVKRSSSDTNSKNLSVSIIGKVKKVYIFHKIADFQYLPMSSTSKLSTSSDSLKPSTQFKFTAFYDNCMFNNINNYEYELKKNTLPQLFILPPFFSRFDDPVNYAFKQEPTKKSIDDKQSDSAAQSPTKNKTHDKDDSNQENNNEDNLNEGNNSDQEQSKSSNTDNSKLIRSMRLERNSQAILVAFNCKEVPQNPSDKLKPVRSDTIRECIEKLKSLFSERPCFLKSVLLCLTNYSPSILKESLPYVAYYFTTGPWRSCWVRYGYDPRKHREAKIYQMIDYRLRYHAEPEQKVKPKPRSSYHKRKFRSDLSENESDDYKNFKLENEMYKFKEDQLPMSRNVFYQMCDIDDEDVQALINSQENDAAMSCNEKDGWFTSNIQDKCRNIMNQKHEKLSKSLSAEQKDNKKNKK